MTTITPGTDKLTQADIDGIASLYSTYLVDTGGLVAFLEFEDLLVAATEKVASDSERHLAHTLINYWFKNFEDRIVRRSISIGTVDAIVNVMQMLDTHQLLEPMLRDAHGRNMLAWMCLIRIMAHEINKDHPATDDVGNILQKWFGKPHIQGAALTMAATVDRLYGPGVWELFTSDAASPTDVPSHLFRQGLQANGPVRVAAEVDGQVLVELPKDFGV